MKQSQSVREQALERPLQSIDPEAPADIETAWSDVIARRAREAFGGTAPTRDLDEALDEVEARARVAAR